MEDRLLTLREMARRYAVSPWTFGKWVKRYNLPHVRVGRRVLRFDPDAVASALTRLTAREKGVADE